MFGRHVTPQLSAYHHQEVSASERLQIEAHLRTCSRCRDAYDEIRLGARLASSLKVVSAPASVWPELSATRPAFSRRRWIPLASLAGLASLLVFVVIHRTQRPCLEVRSFRQLPRPRKIMTS